MTGFDKNGYENECIIIRKWLDSEKTVDLWGVWGLLLVVLWWNGGFVGSWNEYFGSKMGRLPKSFPKDFRWFFWIFYSVMGKWNKMCVEIALARFQNKNILKKCKISPIKKALKKCHIL